MIARSGIGVALTYRFGGEEGQTMTFRVSELITCRDIIEYMSEKYGPAEIIEPRPDIRLVKKPSADLDSSTITRVAQCAAILLARLSRGATA
jgi:hypothetical protein